ncbi:MAG: beta-L-arabinofuranosidase domain-containing protein, partial [Paracoccaceae bacterium]
MRKYASVTFSDVKITGAFWSERLETVLTRTIPSQHDQLVSHGILESLTLPQPVPSLRIPRNRHNFTTQIFWDSDVGKWIEAASYALSHRRDPAIELQIEAIIDDLEKAQAPDGYLNCWYLEREPQNRWTNLRDNHELYNAGHMLEGAVAYFHATGRDRHMKIMMRYMDHIADTFGPNPGQRRGYCGHQEIELALIKLFHATGIRKYLDLSTYFINERGQQPHYFDIEREARGEPPESFLQGTYEYSQSHVPVRKQTKVVGHAVRAMYMYTAMADLAAEHGDAGLKSACETLWADVTRTRMYVTGGFGPSASNEGFTKDYDLPNDTAYAETCASVAMVFWAARMLNLDLDGQYADILEQALYNTSLAGLSRDGTQYFYDNKLESDGSHRRWDWHPCPCCTMNVARLVASVAGYFYSAADTEVAVHLYGGATTTLPVAGGSVTLTETSNYPWSGDVSLILHPEGTRDFTLALRIPGWAKGATANVNGV